jgi:hypothetical protein
MNEEIKNLKVIDNDSIFFLSLYFKDEEHKLFAESEKELEKELVLFFSKDRDYKRGS